jgi:O-antigen biosynthesis protein
MKDIATVMMVTFNRLDLTKKMLANLFETTNHPFNLVIIDNFSEKDDTIKYLKELIETKPDCDSLNELVVHFNNENKGIAIARNQALSLANDLDTTWYATIDNDVLVPNNWLTDCIEIVKNNPQYGSIGVNFEHVDYTLVSKNGFEFQDKPQGNLGTACMVFNKSLHKMLGYFNEHDYKYYGMEDSDWGMRTRVLGFRLGYLKENGVHLGEGENDRGEYREFKTKAHQDNLAKFYENCRLYANRVKSLYINKGDD